MMVSTKGRYALRMMIELARRGDGYCSLRDIAAELDASVKYMEQIISALSKAGLVRSARGAGGGYCLTRPASQISAGEILRASEGSLAPVACVEGEDPACEGCASRTFWLGMQEVINRYADEYTLESLVK